MVMVKLYENHKFRDNITKNWNFDNQIVIYFINNKLQKLDASFTLFNHNKKMSKKNIVWNAIW